MTKDIASKSDIVGHSIEKHGLDYVNLQGVLYKRKSSKFLWQARHCLLNRSSLWYFREKKNTFQKKAYITKGQQLAMISKLNADDVEHAGTLELTSYDVFVVDKRSFLFAFKHKEDPEDVIYYRAINEKGLNDWVQCVKFNCFIASLPKEKRLNSISVGDLGGLTRHNEVLRENKEELLKVLEKRIEYENRSSVYFEDFNYRNSYCNGDEEDEDGNDENEVDHDNSDAENKDPNSSNSNSNT
eukprot:Pgem_evm1s7329